MKCWDTLRNDLQLNRAQTLGMASWKTAHVPNLRDRRRNLGLCTQTIHRKWQQMSLPRGRALLPSSSCRSCPSLSLSRTGSLKGLFQVPKAQGRGAPGGWAWTWNGSSETSEGKLHPAPPQRLQAGPPTQGRRSFNEIKHHKLIIPSLIILSLVLNII